MNPGSDPLADWLSAHCDQIAALEAVLAEERTALLNRDPERVQDIARDKNRRLQALSEAAAELAQRLGISLAPDTVADWLDNRATPAQRTTWSRFSSGLERCRQANEANGVLLTARFAQIESSLRYLREAAGGVVYGASGTHTSPVSGQSIARA